MSEPLLSKEEAARSAEGSRKILNGRSQPTTITDVALGTGAVGNAPGGFSVTGATGGLELSERIISEARYIISNERPSVPEDYVAWGPFNLTGYCNGTPILDNKPYAAWDITHQHWVVKPPHLPKWSLEQFPQGHALWQEVRGLVAQVRAILRLPEPFRKQEATRIWAYIHEGRKRAFSIEGEGWIDTANILEKALDQASGHLVDKLKAAVYGQETGPMALGQGLTTRDLETVSA